MKTTRAIVNILQEEYNKAFAPNALTVFKFNERKLAGLHPDGKAAYYKTRLFELKKETLASGDSYSIKWVQNDCFPFQYNEAYKHLIDHCRKQYINLMEEQCHHIVKGRWNGPIDFDFAFELVRENIKDFYTRSSKILAIEELAAEGEKQQLDNEVIASFHDAFNHELWECDSATALRVFNFNNTNKEAFKILSGKHELFHFFLHRLFEGYSFTVEGKEAFYTPFLERYGLSYGTFKGKSKMSPFIDNPKKEAIRQKIINTIPLNDK